MTLHALLAQARQQLIAALALDEREAAIESQMLLRHALGGVSRAWLISHDEQALTPEQSGLYQALLSRRLRGEPVAYLLGQREFFGMSLAVTPDVLIPRSDTETLVEAALARIPQDEPRTVLDLGTGSGAIAIAIAIHRPQARVTAIDRSPGALKVAGDNARNLGASNLEFLQSDWFGGLADGKFDVIVSNPPYIAERDPHLQQGDLRFEPRTALASGPDGLDDIRIILEHAPAYLQPHGWLMLEHGYDQAAKVAALMNEAGWKSVGHAADLAGIDRVTLGANPRG